MSGPADAIDRVKPLLSAYAATIFATGSMGTALDIKTDQQRPLCRPCTASSSLLVAGTRDP